MRASPRPEMSDTPAGATLLSLTRFRWPVSRSVSEWSQSLEARFLKNPRRRRAAKAFLDFSCGVLSVGLAVALDPGVSQFGLTETLRLGAAVGSLLVVADVVGGQHRAMWRYTSLREAIEILASSMVVAAGLAVARVMDLVSFPVVTLTLMALLILFTRIGVRALRRWQIATLKASAGELQLGAHVAAPHRVLIAGAGEHGLSIARHLKRTAPRVELVGFLDDDPAKRDASSNGTPVLGPTCDALAIAQRYDVSEVIVAMPSAEPLLLRALACQLEHAGIRVQAVRGAERFVTGQEVHRPGSATLDELLDQPLDSVAAAVVLARERRSRSRENGLRRVLVTGGAGYIGAHLVRLLLERGYHVRVLDRFDYGRAGIEGLHHSRLEIMEGDICNSRDISRAMRDVHGVVALAAIVGDPACNLDAEETINLNYTATKILAETCSFYGVRRLVFASSCSVYGANSHGWLTERSRLNPVSLYARTRVLSENILFDRCGDVEPVILRLATAYGLSPRMRFDLVVNTLTVRAVVDKRVTIFGGKQWRPHVHCRDAARAFLMALEAPAGDVAGQIFNVGGNALNHTIHKVGELVSRTVGAVEITTQNEVADPRDYRVSFEKIRRALAFEPVLSVEDGIREIAAAVRADPALQRYQDPIYHNVQALQQAFSAPRHQHADFPPARALARA